MKKETMEKSEKNNQYYSSNYVEAEEKAFSKVGGSEFFSSKIVSEYLKLEGNFVRSIANDFLSRQAKRFPWGIIKDFLEIYPPLLKKGRYQIEKELLSRMMDDENFLDMPEDTDIDLMTQYYEEGYDIGGQTALQDIKNKFSKGNNNTKALGEKIKTNFTLTDPNVRNKLKWEAGKRIVGINETTRRLIINELINAYDTGLGFDGMKKQLSALFESWRATGNNQEFTNKRAELIARTELSQSVSWAREESYARRDVRKKSWLAEPSACEKCVQAMGDGIISFDQLFSIGLLGPIAHPRCRCTLLPEVEVQDYLKGYTWHGEADNASHTQE